MAGRCTVCGNRAYPLESITVQDSLFHKVLNSLISITPVLTNSAPHRRAFVVLIVSLREWAFLHFRLHKLFLTQHNAGNKVLRLGAYAALSGTVFFFVFSLLRVVETSLSTFSRQILLQTAL